jgi:hypothetical protein
MAKRSRSMNALPSPSEANQLIITLLRETGHVAVRADDFLALQADLDHPVVQVGHPAGRPRYPVRRVDLPVRFPAAPRG